VASLPVSAAFSGAAPAFLITPTKTRLTDPLPVADKHVGPRNHAASLAQQGDRRAQHVGLLCRSGVLVLVLALLAASCGYHVGGKADTLPDTIQVIAIPAFQNATTEFKIEQFLTQAVVREFINRTRYDVVTEEANADAVMNGTVVNFFVFPVIFDPVTGRSTAIATLTQVNVSLRERRTGRVLYQNPNFEFRERYEVGTDPDRYFEERQAAVQRTSEAMARGLVSAVLEGF
jgi:hypothetical protein